MCKWLSYKRIYARTWFSPGHIQAEAIVSRIKRKAEKKHLRNGCLENINPWVKGSLDALNKVVRRKRKEIATAPNDTVDFQSLIITENYRNNVFWPGVTERFLLDGNNDDLNLILIFGRTT